MQYLEFPVSLGARCVYLGRVKHILEEESVPSLFLASFWFLDFWGSVHLA